MHNQNLHGCTLSAGEDSTFKTGKQAALFLSRVASRQTIEHLVYELETQLEEEQVSPDSKAASTPHTPKARGAGVCPSCACMKPAPLWMV